MSFTFRPASQKDEENRLLAQKFGMEILADLSSYSFVKQKVIVIPYLFAKQHGVLPLEEKNGKVVVAVAHPLSLQPLEEIRLFIKKELQPVFCILPVLEDAIERCYHQKQSEIEGLTPPDEKKERQEGDETGEGYDLLEQSSQNALVRLLNNILMEAIQQGASDIHFEPQEEGLQIRFRIDGILQKRFDAPSDMRSQMLTRIKVMAKLDIAEKRLPQDGRIKLKAGGREIDFRVSTIPVVFGERIVLRILDRSNVVLGLAKIGMQAKTLHLFQKLMAMPEGIILVTGPTGSGKTTTLYSALMEMNAQEMNIMTIEDPVEYKLPSIAQMGVNPKIKLTFGSGLRHILRQDPDVIMIGEIRDLETAEIAIQASLTGHLVFSTLHTNDAPSALTRLADMGIEPYLLSSSVIGILAQRLVRKICPQCKISYTPSEKEMGELGWEEKDVCLWKGRGCDSCFGTGYKGRHGIFELMEVSSPVKKQILESVDATVLRKAAFSHIIDLLQSGRELIKNGITTSAEVLRVVRMGE